jgi:glycosyltransferase involved in cell wall biosynthesis
MTVTPRLSIGLPVYNGEKFLAGAIEALLGQSYEDFELIISDNASTDSTAEICRGYEKQDSRIRYIRQLRNIGLIPNHQFVIREARGELFKMAAHDDLYGRDLLKLCIDALDEHPEVVCSHSWTVIIDDEANPLRLLKYPGATAAPKAPERFRGMLFDGKGDYTYAVIRTSVLRGIPLQDSYHNSDRTWTTELALQGPFYQVPDYLYFRRDHLNEPRLTARERCAILDGRRADRLRHPGARLYGEYIWGYLSAIHRAPITSAEQRECYLWLARWMASRAVPDRDPLGDPISIRQPILYLSRWIGTLILPGRDVRIGEPASEEQPNVSVAAVVPGWDRRSS